MKALLFPGQGSQFVGMGKELYNNFLTAKNIFNEVNETLKQDLTNLMFAGPEEELKKTENAQPAIMVCSVAIIELLKKEFNADLSKYKLYLAGHSLGEYSALYTSGVFNISTVAKLLRERGKAMEQASPTGVSGMAAIIGLNDLAKIQELIDTSIAGRNEICVIANDNIEGQIVVSGHINSIDNVVANAKQFGAKMCIKLPVSGAFHSPLMNKAAEKMAEVLNDIQLSDMIFPVISNVTAREIEEKSAIKPLLVEQITGRVRWRETIEYLASKNVSQFIEVGCSNVLIGMIKRLYPEINKVSLNTIEAIENFAKTI